MLQSCIYLQLYDLEAFLLVEYINLLFALFLGHYVLELLVTNRLECNFAFEVKLILDLESQPLQIGDGRTGRRTDS